MTTTGGDVEGPVVTLATTGAAVEAVGAVAPAGASVGSGVTGGWGEAVWGWDAVGSVADRGAAVGAWDSAGVGSWDEALSGESVPVAGDGAVLVDSSMMHGAAFPPPHTTPLSMMSPVQQSTSAGTMCATNKMGVGVRAEAKKRQRGVCSKWLGRVGEGGRGRSASPLAIARRILFLVRTARSTRQKKGEKNIAPNQQAVGPPACVRARSRPSIAPHKRPGGNKKVLRPQTPLSFNTKSHINKSNERAREGYVRRPSPRKPSTAIVRAATWVPSFTPAGRQRNLCASQHISCEQQEAQSAVARRCGDAPGGEGRSKHPQLLLLADRNTKHATAPPPEGQARSPTP